MKKTPKTGAAKATIFPRPSFSLCAPFPLRAVPTHRRTRRAPSPSKATISLGASNTQYARFFFYFHVFVALHISFACTSISPRPLQPRQTRGAPGPSLGSAARPVTRSRFGSRFLCAAFRPLALSAATAAGTNCADPSGRVEEFIVYGCRLPTRVNRMARGPTFPA